MPAPTDEILDRPPFMAVLGLLPPYGLEDVRLAYRQKVLDVHPDRGGKAADFERVQQAYDQAVEYANLHGNRRSWMAERVKTQRGQEEIAKEVRRLGGRVEY